MHKHDILHDTIYFPLVLQEVKASFIIIGITCSIQDCIYRKFKVPEIRRHGHFEHFKCMRQNTVHTCSYELYDVSD